MAEQDAGAILVVDDDAAFRRLVTTMLEQGGYRTAEAASGEEALNEVQAREPAVVVLDVRLPGLSGHEVCRRLRNRPGGGPPVLFISGERTETFDRVGGLLLGGDDYLVKPFFPDELLVRVRNLIRRARSRSRPALTERETEILRLLAEGLDHKEIAGRLDLSSSAVRADLRDIFTKATAAI